MKKLTKDDIVKKANIIFNNVYDYSLFIKDDVEYTGNTTKMPIICKKHGVFYKSVNKHLCGQGCPKCSSEKNSANKTLTTEEFIKRAKEVHGDKYSYEKTKYVDALTPVTITCKIHGDFEQIPHYHLSGNGCQKCGLESRAKKRVKPLKQFISDAKEKHGDKYDYSKVEYRNEKSVIKIKCPIHGEFEQIADNHVRGQGCPKCNSSSLENEIRTLLTESKISFEEQKRFSWMGLQRIDFYLSDYNIAIECQGKQHYYPIDFFGGIDDFIHRKELDENKKKLCKQNGVKLLYYSDKKYSYDVIDDKNKLLEEIMKT
jgi:very-short-patch-repair endonuclease